MINLISRNILRFVVLVLIQGLILNNINLGGLVNPYLYVLILLMLPQELPPWANLVIGFATGVAIDAFSNTLGMHTSACVFVGFARPYVLQLLAPRDGYEFGSTLHLQRMGFTWFFTYAGVIILLHHLWLYNVEALRISELPRILLKTLVSGGISLTLIIIGQYLTFNNRISS